MQQVISEFEAFMSKHGTHYHQFYVGIASDPNDRLVNGHGIDQTIPHVYWNQPLHTEVVRAVEKHFIGKGAKGGPGGGDQNTRYIYTYLVTQKTRQ
jgi:hypothetical protein